LSSAEARYLRINLDELLEKLKQYAKSKAETHQVRTIILAGSLAKGSYTGMSDADILVIADDLPTNVLERYLLFAESTLSVDVEPRVYTTKEFLRLVQQGDIFALESLRSGIPLYGDQFFRELKESLKKEPPK
jgi:predicted nucleotidyltransferase